MGKRSKKRNKQNKKPVKTKPGKYTIFGGVPIEQGALTQMDNAMSLPVSIAGALMPDAHEGYGLPIGGVLATDNTVIPYAVGMDIGCTMTLSIYETEPDFLEKNKAWLKKILIRNTRFGTDEFDDIPYDPVLDRPEFREIKFLKEHHKTAIKQFGTSGRGNHFVEFGYVEIMQGKDLNIAPGKYFGILSHSGSRHFGFEIAKHYSKLAARLLDIPQEIKHLAWLQLDKEEGQEYWKAMTLAGDYAKANHNYIHQRLAKALGMQAVATVQNHHNFAWKEQCKGREVIVHRKGATPAFDGVLGIIPGNMVMPAYIVKGKGNPDSIYSASHGAGRAMSRTKAKKTFTRRDLDKILQQHGVTLIGGGLDEHPLAYKNIDNVMQVQQDLVDILGKFYPKIVRME